jgi:hypothetical protein
MSTRISAWAILLVGIVHFGSATVANARTIEAAINSELGPGPQSLAFDDDTQASTFSDGGDGRLDVGDRLRAHLVVRNVTRTIDERVVTLGGVDVVPPTDVNELTGQIEIQVISKTGNATDGFTFEFGAWTSGGAITSLSSDSNAVIALYEDESQNGMLAGAPIPDPTLVDGQLWGVLTMGGPGLTTFTVRTERQPDGLHHDESSAAVALTSDLLGSGTIRLNLSDQGGDALTDAGGVYAFVPNSFGTDFGGTFDFFGGAGTGADFTAAIEFRANVAIIPLPPAVLAALPGMAILAVSAYRRQRKH